MSYCKKEGKDIIIFSTKEDHQVPSTIKLPEIEKPVGVTRPDGSINWGCPCLGGMATGPCGIEFREAFTCFSMSKAEPKGSDCVESSTAMHQCFLKYPTVYGRDQSNVEFDDDEQDSEKVEASEKDNSVEKVSNDKKT